jgi:MOSC domain-containing protein YiiM
MEWKMRNWQGTVSSIHIAHNAGAKMQSIREVRAIPGRGLEGDRYFYGIGFLSSKPIYGGHEITLVELEALEALNRDVNTEAGRAAIKISAADTRRNIATCGVALNSLVDREFWVGEVLLRGTRLTEPCKHLDELTTPGIRIGLMHRAGLRARILNQGTIRVGDSIRPLDSSLPSEGF